jgi:trk system potassium uptake protein TrkH
MNYRSDLLLQYRIVLKNIGWLSTFFSVILLLPLISLVFYPEEIIYAIYFIESAMLSFVFGTVLNLFFRKGTRNSEISFQYGAVIVVSIWIIMIFFSSLPFIFAKILTFTQAIFESTSGWTTTGLTVVDVSRLPRIFLLWRSITQYIGGAGFAVIMFSSIGGGVSSSIYQAEGRTDNLLPNLKKTAKFILVIYVTYAVMGIVALLCVGLGPFDAVNHTLTGLATGGFSTKLHSVGELNNPAAEVILEILMLLGATGFGIHFLIWQRNFDIAKKNVEPRILLLILIVFIPLVFFSLSGIVYPDSPTGIRHAVFQAVSALSGTGFQTTDFVGWPHTALYLITLLMVFGGMMDSTSGGVKLMRLYIVIKAIAIEITYFFLPKGAVRSYIVWKGNSRLQLDNRMIKNTAVFFSLYIIAFIVGVSIFLFKGYDLMTACFEYASALSNVGLSLGVTHAETPRIILWNEIFGMFFGRLEFIVILYSLAKIIRDAIRLIR